MKTNFLIFILTIFCLTSYSQNYIEPKYSFTKTSTLGTILLTYEIIVKNIGDGLAKNDENSDHYSAESRIKEQILKQFEKNIDVEIYVNYPKYMDEIFGLIETSSNRLKAKEILIQNIKPNAITTNSNTSISIANGVKSSTYIMKFSIPLKLNSSKQFDIKELVFIFRDNEYRTNSITIITE